MTNVYSLKQTTTATCVALITLLVISPMVNAADNDKATASEATGVDMQGNIVELGNFRYGGDDMAKYADGKMGTGKKDPAVCGSFSSAKCSVGHLQEK